MPLWDATGEGRRTQLEQELGIALDDTVITPDYEPSDDDADGGDYDPDEPDTVDFGPDFDPDYDPVYDPSDDYDHGPDGGLRPVYGGREEYL